MNTSTMRRWLPLIALIGLFILFFSLRLDNCLNFTALKDHRTTLITWAETHFLTTSILFIAVYTAAVAVSIPGAVFLTLAGGFMFGIGWGLVLVVLSATLGATLLFLAVRTTLGVSLSRRASGWIESMHQGFQNHAFSYLLTLRLIPLFPFWVVNIVPALLGVRAKTFILATFIGIIPGSTVYVLLGNSLSEIFAANQTPDLGIIFEPKVLGPLLALAALSLIPVLYRVFTGKRNQRDEDLCPVKSCDLAIIGAGAGGLSLAAGAAQLGLNVVLVESGKMGGDCLNYGCVPSKSLLAAAKSFYHLKNASQFGIHAETLSVDFPKVMQHVREVIANIAVHDSVSRFESLGVEVIKAAGTFLGPDSLKAGENIIHARHFVIATGSSASIPPICGLDSVSFLTNETIFNLEEQPEHLIVIGGGPVGCELGQAFAMLGSRVTILEESTILPKDDANCVAIVRDSLKAMNVAVYEGISIRHIESHPDGGSTLFFECNGESQTTTGSHLLIATGRKANLEGLHLERAGISFTPKGIDVNARLQTSNRRIYAIGDVAGPYQFTHMASYHAGIVLRNIVFKLPAKVDYRAVPWVTFTEPELAHAGLSALDALKRSDTQVTEWLYVDNDKAQTEHALNGKIKIITDKKARILGVTVVGSNAGELILPWVMAIRERKTLRCFTDVIAPYPTLSELSKRVAGEFYKPRLFSEKTRWLVRLLQKIRINA
ncbi:mercuric reductase [Legionella geestiana]|uniref:FAD-dependent oxidoreductase n=1 Tax=Legionella geestiana TaxID=45065 RepID=UPI001091F18B|nr:bifunctional TVP38/TMEM64 family protein/FAD-dependent oxidoreductase [Legionella geestiana]QDQ40862.1 mercuric reductase [Legionella geestiana]